jgi:hypothetical protein
MGGLLYAVNPITAFVCAYHGQFDALPSLFILLALYWFGKNTDISGIWLGLGILSKSWPILAFPPLWAKIKPWMKKLSFIVIVLACLFLSIGIYIFFVGADPVLLLNRVLSYNRGIGVWGYTYLVRLLSIVDPKFLQLNNWFIQYSRWITIIGISLVWWWTNLHRKLPQEVFLAMLASFFAITHAFAIQYLAWIVPFAILCQEFLWLRRFVLAAFAYMFLAYTTLILGMYIDRIAPWPQADWLIIIPAGLPAWLVCVGWTRKLLMNSWDADKTIFTAE